MKSDSQRYADGQACVSGDSTRDIQTYKQVTTAE